MGCQRKRDPVRDIPAWKTLSSTPLADYRIAKVRAVSRLHPITGKAHDFYVMDCPDWVNIVAVTTDQRLILVRQYRHGTDTVDLEFPGGVMDAEDPTPEFTAIRELREETGYQGQSARVIGKIAPNPAIQGNYCHTVLIEGCELKHATEFDPSEDIETILATSDQMHQLIGQGRIQHALVVVAWTHYQRTTTLPSI